MNVVCMHAVIGAYTSDGRQWVDELCQTLSDTIRYAYDYIQTHFSGIQTTMPEGTYMMLLDCEAWCTAHKKTHQELLEAGWDAGVIWQDGSRFHMPYGVRMNFALPRSRVEEAMDRLNRLVFNA